MKYSAFLFLHDSELPLSLMQGMNFELYKSLRDAAGYSKDRVFLEDCFSQFSSFIGDEPIQFKKQLVQHPHSVIWHLGLLKFLHNNGFNIECAHSDGPDILANIAGVSVCIEAAACQMGRRVEPRVFRKGICVEYTSKADWRVISRITQQIETKILKRQIVAEKVAILAVSAVGVDRSYLMDPMNMALFSNNVISLDNGSCISLDYADKLLSVGFKYVFYSAHDPIIYEDNYQSCLDVYNLTTQSKLTFLQFLDELRLNYSLETEQSNTCKT